MRTLMLLSFIVLVQTLSFAQEIDYNKIILPQDARPTEIIEKLVTLAWNNYPQNLTFEHRLRIATIEKKMAAWNWLKYFRASFNANEFTINPELANGNVYYPRYNFGLGIDLGVFLHDPLLTKQRNEEIAIVELGIKQQKLAIRTMVITRYEKYKLQKEIVKIQSGILEDYYSEMILNEQNFKNGNIYLEQYNTSRQNYYKQYLNKIEQEAQLNIVKAELEELIGIGVESVE